MSKRKLELDVDVIESLIKIMAQLSKQGEKLEIKATKRGIEIPEEVQKMNRTLRVIYKSLYRANASVEIEELESMLALPFEGTDK